MRRGITVAAKIWLVVALCIGVGGAGIGVLTYELKVIASRYEDTLRGLQERVRQQDASRVMQVTFKKEVQEWKDTLLRGSNPQDLAKYSAQFRAEASKVDALGSALQASVSDPEARAAFDDFLKAHAILLNKYDQSLKAFTAGGGQDAHGADSLVRGQDRAPTDLIDKAVGALVKRANAAVASENDAVSGAIWTVSLCVLAAFAAIGVLAGFAIRNISGALHRAVTGLNETARQMAAAAAQVSGASQSLAQSSSEQAAALEQTSAATSEINTMARQNSDSSTGRLRSRHAVARKIRSNQAFDGADGVLHQ
jgi:methyl-accepting chemotaxis protein